MIDCLPEFVPYGNHQDQGERENFDSIYRSLISAKKAPNTQGLNGKDYLIEHGLYTHTQTPGGVTCTVVTAHDVILNRSHPEMPLKIHYPNDSSFKQHLSRISMHRQIPDMFLDDHDTGHPYRVNAANLSGPEMTEAICESMPHLVDLIKWGPWIDFVPGNNSKQTKAKVQPAIKKSLDVIKKFAEKFLPKWFHNDLCFFGKQQSWSHAQTAAKKIC